MRLTQTQCPYDGSQLEFELLVGGSVRLFCCWCDAAWETHGAWIGRVQEPDRQKLRAALLEVGVTFDDVQQTGDVQHPVETQLLDRAGREHS